MRRRAFLTAIGAGATLGTAGCLGLGGEAIVSVRQSVRIEPGSGWIKEIPDVSDTGGAISYTVRSDERRFDVYFFRERGFEQYEAYIHGDDPERTPAGHDEFSSAAVPAAGGSTFEASTDEGARESIDVAGPYYFVVDHSSYRMENRVDEYADPLPAFVDLEVVRNRL